MRIRNERTAFAPVAIEWVIIATLLAAGLASLSNLGQGTAQKSVTAGTSGANAAHGIQIAYLDEVRVVHYTTYYDTTYGGMFNAAHGNTPGPSQHEDFNPITGPSGPFGAGAAHVPRIGGMFNANDGNTAGPSQHEDFNPITGPSGPFG